MLVITLLGSQDAALLAALREQRLRVTAVELDRFAAAHPAGSKAPDVFVVDIRTVDQLPREIAQIRRQFPTSGLVVLARSIDSSHLLEAMRLGVKEWLPEPFVVADLVAAIQRVAGPITKPQIGRTIAIIGAKGGVGATTMAVNLATSLHRANGDPTLVVDLHLAHGDAAVLLGAEPRYSVLDAIQNIHRLDESYFRGLVVSTNAGVDLLGSSSTLIALGVDTAGIRALIDFAATCYRYIVLDCPRTDATMLDALDVASQVVVLSSQELTSVKNASRMIGALRQRCGAERVKLAISRLDPRAEIAQSDMERVLGSPVKYVIPNDYRVSASAVTRGEPLILQNHSRLAASFEDVAHDLGGLQRKTKKAAKSGLFGRFSA